MAFEVLQVKTWINLPKRSRHQNGLSRGRHQTQSRFQAIRVQATKAFVGEQQHLRPTASPLGLQHRVKIVQLLTAEMAEANSAVLQEGAIDTKQFLKCR